MSLAMLKATRAMNGDYIDVIDLPWDRHVSYSYGIVNNRTISMLKLNESQLLSI